jgi:hypothetical protein
MRYIFFLLFSVSAYADPYINDGGATDNAGDSRIIITRTAGNEVSGNAHAFSDQTTIARRGSVGFASFDARPNFTGGSYNHFAGFQSAASVNIAGSMDNLYNFYTGSGVGTGYVGRSFGLYVSNAPNQGTINSQYGIYIEDLSSGNNNQGIRLGLSAGDYKYNIYANGTAPSYFNHTLMLGNSAAPSSWTGGGQLFVEGGALKFRGSNGTITIIAQP